MNHDVLIKADGTERKLLFCVVRREDIWDNCHTANNCPVAEAMRRAAPQYEWPVADLTYLAFYSEEHGLEFKVPTPPEVARFIHWYDLKPFCLIDKIKRWFYVRPFTFYIEIPPEAQ